MKKPILKLVTEFADAKWIQDILYPWEEPYFGCLGSVIPIGFESYLAIRHENNDKSRGPLGNLNEEKLSLILRDYTTCPENCLIGIWNGFGWSFEEEYPELFEGKIYFDKYFELPDRSYYLLNCDILDSLRIGSHYGEHLEQESPNLMWPQDKSWFVSKEIDFEVTLVGGSEELIKEIENTWAFATERFDPKDPKSTIFIAG